MTAATPATRTANAGKARPIPSDKSKAEQAMNGATDANGNWNLFGWGDGGKAGDTHGSLDGLRPGLGTFEQRGAASWYGGAFHGRKTATGERFDMDAMTAAHPSLPLDSWVLVRNLRNNKVAVLRINDRGPYHGNRVLDVSRKAAKRLGFIERGSTQVEIRRLSRMELAALGPVNSWDADGATEGGGDDTADTASQSQLASNLVDPSAAPAKAAKSSKPAARARKVSARRTAH